MIVIDQWSEKDTGSGLSELGFSGLTSDLFEVSLIFNDLVAWGKSVLRRDC